MEWLVDIGKEFGVVVSILAVLLFALWKTVAWLGDRLLGDEGLATRAVERHIATLDAMQSNMQTLTQVQSEILTEVRSSPCRTWDGTERRLSDQTQPMTVVAGAEVQE